MTSRSQGRATPVHELVRRAARRFPDAVAVHDGQHVWSYAELIARADAVAAALARRGVGCGGRVTVRAGRSPQFVAGVLGTLMAGGTYVPVDPSLPLDRRRFIIGDVGADAHLSLEDDADDACPASVPIVTRADLVDTPGSYRGPAAQTPSDLAYVIYTSGSTGMPKGVEITHVGLSNLVAWHLRAFALSASDRTSLVAGVGFDASVWELWPSLVAGATALVAPERARTSAPLMRDWLVTERVTVSFLPTVLAERVIDLAWPDDTALRTLLTGGDTLHRRPPAGLPFALVNNYGPTECTVVATSGVVTPGTGRPRIGRLVDGLDAAVLDEAGQPVRRGHPGELHLAGSGLARGYAGRPELTERCFVQLQDGRRAYRTGDIVIEHPDGTFDFVGRADDQVKVRGHRVEPGEVAQALASHETVASAVVVPRSWPDGELGLVAYVTATDPLRSPSPDELRDHLRVRLPSWMVPAVVVPVEELPQNPNGKIDRDALPDPAEWLAQRPRTGPSSAHEQAVAAIWAEVLGHHAFGVDEPFDEVGGHSLAAAQVRARVASQLGTDVAVCSITTSTVAQQASQLSDGLPAHPLRRAGRPGPAPLTGAQRRLWLLDRTSDHAGLYTNALLFWLRGAIDVDALKEAFQGLVDRHEVLRTAFVDAAGEPVQSVRADVRVPMVVVDLRGVPGHEREGHLQALVADYSTRPINLTSPPLLRAVVIRLENELARLVLTVHHIAYDGASTAVMLDDLGRLYTAAVEAREPDLRPLPVQLSDVAYWEREDVEQEGGPLLSWWRAQVQPPVSPLALPLDSPRPDRPAHRGHTLSRRVPTDLREELHRSGGAFTPVLASLLTVLHRETGSDDIVVGVPVVGRTRAEMEPLVGCFVNTLPLRCRVDREATFAALQASSAGVAAGAVAHQELAFDRIVSLAREAAGPGDLVRVMLVVQPEPSQPRHASGLHIAFDRELHCDTARFDLTLVYEHAEGETLLSVEYASELFDEDTAARILDQVLLVLEAGLTQPHRRVGELPLMGESERRAALAAGAGRERALPKEPAHELVFRRADSHPSGVAIECGPVVLTYGRAAELADELARSLVSAGARPESPVVVCLERSAGSVVALLGTMASGGVYIPVDPAYPDDLLRQLFTHVGRSSLVTSETLSPRLRSLGAGSDSTTVLLRADGSLVPDRESSRRRPAAETWERPSADLRAAAYAIHTSGSTGRPKRVLLEHRGLLNLILGKIERFGIRRDSRVLQFVSFGFGVSVADVLMTLAAGATLVVRGTEPLAGRELVRVLSQRRVSHLVVPSSVLASLPPADLPALRTIVVGGEPCSADLVDRWAPGRELIQAYGPTEATVCTTTAVCRPSADRPPVGRPIPNTRAVVVDRDLEPVPRGVVGELLISGFGLARGYADLPGLTAERFVPDPTGDHPGERAYRTGDLARLRPDGQVELLGRDDDQMQLRGIRVEAGEVEAALRTHPAVEEAAVAVRETAVSGQLLVGYVVTNGSRDRLADEVREHVRTSLPSALVPAVVVVLSSLPRTASGKIDRRNLPAPPTAPQPSRAPETLTERMVAQIWEQLLFSEEADPAPIGAEVDFFSLGGQSIIAAQVAGRIREVFRVPLPTRAVFDNPTVGGLARRIEEAILADLEPVQDARQTTSSPNSTPETAAWT